jgi:hypothetical protein
MTTTGKNRIMIFGPKTDGTYVVEFRTAEGESLAISIPGRKSRSSMAQRSNKSPANASARSGGTSIKSIRSETGHAGQLRKAPQFQFDVGSRTFG